MLGSSRQPLGAAQPRASDAARPAPEPAHGTAQATAAKAVVARVQGALATRQGTRQDSTIGDVLDAVARSVRSAAAELAEDAVPAQRPRGEPVAHARDDAAAIVEPDVHRPPDDATGPDNRVRDGEFQASGVRRSGDGEEPATQPAVAPAIASATPARTVTAAKSSASVGRVATPLSVPVQRVRAPMTVRREGKNPQASTARMILWGVALAGAAVIAFLLLGSPALPDSQRDEGHDAAAPACSGNTSGCAK